MSLLVWLPMTKDLTQQGISDITVSNNGITLDSSNGKLGKCYYFDGNAHYLQFSKSVGDLYSGDFSYAVWLKPTDDTRSIICSEYSASGASGIAFELTASRQIRLYWNGSPDIYATGCVLPKDVWTHCAITRSGNVAKFYMNGILTYTYEGTLANKTSTANIRLGDDYRGGSSVTYMGYMNDFRLYNHCLSAKEVEILSRGLVAHYPLNDGGRGGDNILKGTNLGKSGWVWSAASGSRSVETYDVTGVKMTVVEVGSSWNMWYFTSANLASSLQPDTDYTVSVDILPPQDANINCGIIQTNSSNPICPFVLQSVKANKWNHLVFNLHSNSSFTASNQVVYMNGIAPDTVGKTIYLKNLKMELGTVATPWMPNPSDTAYTTMGYNSTTEYDVSGYQNDMTKTGTITYTSDSARYSVASHFINGSYIMANQNCGEYLPKDSLTVNLWIKPTTWGTPISCTEGGGWNFESYNNNLQFQCYISGVGYKGAASTVPHSTLMDGKWHMLTGTFDRIAQQTKFYIDGELKGTNSTSSSNAVGYANNRLIISGEAQSTTPASSYFVGEESDVRIYATALTADQVLDLYKSSASVANNGTLIGYEFIEN